MLIVLVWNKNCYIYVLCGESCYYFGFDVSLVNIVLPKIFHRYCMRYILSSYCVCVFYFKHCSCSEMIYKVNTEFILYYAIMCWSFLWFSWYNLCERLTDAKWDIFVWNVGRDNNRRKCLISSLRGIWNAWNKVKEIWACRISLSKFLLMQQKYIIQIKEPKITSESERDSSKSL